MALVRWRPNLAKKTGSTNEAVSDMIGCSCGKKKNGMGTMNEGRRAGGAGGRTDI